MQSKSGNNNWFSRLHRHRRIKRLSRRLKLDTDQHQALEALFITVISQRREMPTQHDSSIAQAIIEGETVKPIQIEHLIEETFKGKMQSLLALAPEMSDFLNLLNSEQRAKAGHLLQKGLSRGRCRHRQGVAA